MSFLKNLKKVLFGKNNIIKETSPNKTDMTEYESSKAAIKPLLMDFKTDFQLLLSIYKQNKIDGNIDSGLFVRKINPEATAHKCPYCAVIHEFTASRARKCPSCSKNMIVRKGLFISEEQVKQIDTLIQDFYEKQSLLTRIGYLLESIQNSKIQKDNIRYMMSFAEAFQYTAQFTDKRDSRGYSFWDKAWGYYETARLQAMKELTDKDMFPYTNLPDISWHMAQMLLDQAQSESSESCIKKIKKQALTQACITLAEAAKFNTNPFFLDDLYTFTKRCINELAINTDEFKEIVAKSASIMRLNKMALGKYEDWIKDLLEYEII